MLTLSRDHTQTLLKYNITKAVEGHNLCNFGAILSRQWKVIALFISEPRFHVGG